MSTIDLPKKLAALRNHYRTGITKPYAWRRQQLLTLKEALLAHEKEIAGALYADLKKSPEEAYGTETGLALAEINTTLKHLRKWMQPRTVRTNLVNLPSSSVIYRDPLGVVLVIAPWNYPLQLSLIPLVGALAAGNCVVLKPSELSPATAVVLEKILTKIFPPEYVLVIPGDGAELVPAMMQSFRFDHVFFTGSIPVGRAVYQLAAQDLIPVTLELGGKSPAVVESDADLPTAARRIALGKFTNAGQTCIAPDYLLVHADIRDKFLRLLQETLLKFYGERPEDSHDYGRIINEKRFDTLTGYLSQAEILYGGRYDRSTLFIAPTLLDGSHLHGSDLTGAAGNLAIVDSHSLPSLMTEEIFGPLLPVCSFRTMEEALAIIERNPDPLAFYLFTKDKDRQTAWMQRLSFGGGCINNTEWHFTNHHLPFGGVGPSGIGAYHGKYTFDTFTHEKAVMTTPTAIDPSIKYPPFKGKLKWFKLFIR